MDERILKKLYETFDLKERKGTGGMVFRYVPNEDVINRMNTVFGGNWNTKVMDKDIIDDQVVVEVQVDIFDGDKCYSHTGFGSQQIMRYNSGPNAGKIIDVGNAYKGALAKGIVNACTRWGVGLFKEKNAYQMDNVTMVDDGDHTNNQVPVMAPSAPRPAPAPITSGAPSMPSMPTSAQPTPQPKATIAAPTAVPQPRTPAQTTASPSTTFMPPKPTSTPKAMPTVEATTMSPAIPFPNQPISTTVSVEQTKVEPPVSSLPSFPAPNTAPPIAEAAPARPTIPMTNGGGNLNEVGISDVQRVALNGILSMNKADYNELAREAFDSKGMAQQVPPKEDLSYEEAVVVIKYGNDKFRKNR